MGELFQVTSPAGKYSILIKPNTARILWPVPYYTVTAPVPSQK